jgi:lysophospholipase L1-like esterase
MVGPRIVNGASRQHILLILGLLVTQISDSTANREQSNAGLFMSGAARRRLLGAGFGLFAALGTTYLVPFLSDARPWTSEEGYVPFWNLIGREFMGQEVSPPDVMVPSQGKADNQQPDAPAPEDEALIAEDPKALELDRERRQGLQNPNADKYPPYAPLVAMADAPKPTPIEFAERLRYFFAKLTLTELGKPGAITRASHWGDSVLGDDGVTHAIRRRLQRRFGDAGHGFHVLGRYNLGYLHRGVNFKDKGGWHRCEIIFKCEDDGLYGFGGVSSHSGGGGTSTWSTSEEGFGAAVSRFELWYLKHDEGGKFQIKVDDKVERIVNTRADVVSSGWEEIVVPDGAHEFEVRAIGEGSARGFGVVLERNGPGVVWDGLALIGSFTQRLDYQQPTHIAEQIKRRNTDLLVFMLGGNDVQREKMDLYRTLQPYEDEYTQVIRKYRAGKPDASCLIMSLTDHGERVGRAGIRTRRIVPKLVASQRKVAEAEGCAFFNTFEAMGGDGSVGRWYYSNPRLAGADFSHPTSAGHEVIADLLVTSLMQAYEDFRVQVVGQPLPVLP